MNRSAWLSCLLVVGSTSVGCVAPAASEGESVGVGKEGIAGDGASSYYVVTRPDVRRCAYPTCGGVFVKKVNKSMTLCADGVLRSECHVVDLDLGAIGLADADAAKYQDTFAGGHGIVRGSLFQVWGGSGRGADTLAATEAWVTATLAAPSGTFYGLSSSGIACFASPCPSIVQEKLDSSSISLLADVDLTGSGANEKQIAQALGLLSTTGLLASGTHATVHGPAGDGQVLDATQFYTRLEPQPAAPAGVACGSNTCGENEYCCNPSCGICARPGTMCILHTCN